MSDHSRQATSGGDVERCRECGASLAADQRYCLNCGRRRGEPRLDFRRYVPGDRTAGDPQAPPAAVPSSAAPAQPAERPPRDYTPLAAAGGIAVLGLMLLVGVLIGRGNGNQAAAPPPQVVRVESGAETGANEGEDALGSAGAPQRKGNEKRSGKTGAASGGSGKAPPPEITASDSELEALQGKSPQEYSEASAKLPDEIATPGEAPPVDSKPPGGGSEGTAIE